MGVYMRYLVLVFFGILYFSAPVKADTSCSPNGVSLISNNGASACGVAPSQRPLATIAAGGSQLPSCASGIKGVMYFVSDALLPVSLAIVAGGGAIAIGVTCNGTNWIVQ